MLVSSYDTDLAPGNLKIQVFILDPGNLKIQVFILDPGKFIMRNVLMLGIGKTAG